MAVRIATRKRFFGLLRLLAFLVAVQAGALCLAVGSTRAEVNEMMMDLGARMMRYAQASRQDRPRTLLLNGLALRFASGTTRRTVVEVLDRFHARCRQNSGRLAEQIEAIMRRGPSSLDYGRGRLLDGTLRYGGQDRGFIACLDLGADEVSPQEILHRVNRFLRIGDLSELGGLRYAMAEQGERMTSFIAFWTEGEVDLFEAFPSDRDAPGRDAEGVPRAPNSVRVLSAWEPDRAPSLAVYRVPSLDSVDLPGFYRRSLAKNGWRLLEREPEGGTTADRTLFAERQGRTVAITLGVGAGEQQYVIVSEMN
jgi:hypothetical protein